MALLPRLRIIDYGPYRSGQTPGGPNKPTTAQFNQDLRIMSGMADVVRLYSLQDGQDYIVDHARDNGLKVIPAAYLHNPGVAGNTRLSFAQLMQDGRNQKEINDLIALLNRADARNIPFAVIGNEAISQVGAWDDRAVIDAIAYVRARIPAGILLTTAEPAGGQYVINNPASSNQTRLGQAVDVIFANVFPYWEGIPVENAAAYVVAQYDRLRATYPGKDIVISETGWPSEGPDVGAAHPSVENQVRFWIDFRTLAHERGISFAGFEAFDEPFKADQIPGDDPEAHWGLYNVDRQPKSSIMSLDDDVLPHHAGEHHDLNGDDRSDLLWQRTDGSLAVWLTDDSGHHIPRGIIGSPGASWRVRDTGDFNGDDRSDVLWQNDDGSVALWLMNSTGTAPASGGVMAQLGRDWRVVSSGDLNNDGHDDIIWQHTDGSLAFWLMNPAGTGPIGGGIVGNPGAGWRVRGSDDFNADGRDDVLWQHDDGSVAVWLTNGLGTGPMAGGIMGNPGVSWKIVGSGDFNDDGAADFLWRNDDGSIATWLMNRTGTGPVAGGVIGRPEDGMHVRHASDVNGDGRDDLILQGDDGSVEAWMLNATGTGVSGRSSIGRADSSWNVVGDDGPRFLHGVGHGTDDVVASNEREWFDYDDGVAAVRTIRNFDVTQDVLVLNRPRFEDLHDVLERIAVVPTGSLISLSHDGYILLEGIRPGDLRASNFSFQ